MMTVRDVMEMLKNCDPNAEVIPCDWDDEVAIRVFDSNGMHEIRSAYEEEED